MMRFLQIQFTNLKHLALTILVTIASSKSSLSATPPNFPIAKPNCTDRCGNVSIPYPFGTRPECYYNRDFLVTCNRSSSPPKTFLRNSTIEITAISLDGQLRVLQFVGHDCYNRNGTSASYSDPWITLSRFTLNDTVNKFTMIGCDTYGFISGWRLNRTYLTGCTATCEAEDDLIEGSCTGLGCCQAPIPNDVSTVELTLKSYYNFSNVWSFNNCSYAFLVEESAFTFSRENLTNMRDVKSLPIVVDWAIGNCTCEEAQMNASSYTCKSGNSACHNPDTGYGYRCSCLKGYQGNPYLVDGCQDIDECNDPSLNICEKHCVNTMGSFNCACPKGYYGDGRKDGKGCIRRVSLELIKLIAGLPNFSFSRDSLRDHCSAIDSLLDAFGIQEKKAVQNETDVLSSKRGILLQEKINRREISSDAATIFGESELQKATNNFHDNMIIGQGGFGTVYKGILPDNRIVAIKKSKEVDQNQIEQFINEVVILSQINHRNVVKLLGCCLEKQVPLLVYEFISNGTLFEHIHNKKKACFLSWETRLKIAAETANVLAYLHSAASTPIIHRDVKSTNILLDHTLTAKVSDFGASRLVPLDQTQLVTMVHGTLGYLDPDYMITNQLTEKSDVYSFGVVLAELLTGQKALSFDRPVEERGLANLFLSAMEQERLFEILEDNVVREGNKEQLMRVAVVAKSCLHVQRDARPSMKEVAKELEGLMVREKHPWVQTGRGEEVELLLLGGGFSGSIYVGEGTSTNIDFDSAKDHVALLPMNGGR